MCPSATEMARALERRDEGMASSAQHAEEAQPGWGERARDAIRLSLYLRAEPEWTMDFARQWAYACGLAVPPEERAWGAVSKKLVRDGNHRCRPCVAEYSRERRAMKSTRRVVEQRAVPLGPEFAIFMAACAVGGGDANAPTMVRAGLIETINDTVAMQ